MFLVVLDMGTQQERNVIEAAGRAGVKHVVKLSTLNTGRLTLQLDRWHRDKEEVIRTSGLRYVDLPEEKAAEGRKRSGIPGPVVDALVEVMKDRRSGPPGVLTNTVQRVTKRSAKTFEEWCYENADRFR
jgi:hypothetical protein